MKKLILLALVLGTSLGLAACGQRVQPAYPEGKVIPSNQY